MIRDSVEKDFLVPSGIIDRPVSHISLIFGFAVEVVCTKRATRNSAGIPLACAGRAWQRHCRVLYSISH